MGAAMTGEERRRNGGARALALAFAGSLLLHAVLFGLLPNLRELSAWVPPEPLPLIARLVRPEPPPAPAPAKPEPRILAPQVKSALREQAPRPTPAPEVRPEAATEPDAAPAASPPPTAASASASASGSPPMAIAAPAPAPAAAAPDARAIEGFRRDVTQQAARYKRYPRVAIDNNWQGEVVARMTIGADGRIAGLRIERSSGYEVLDRQALEMFRNAKPLVPLPNALRGREFELELRAVYRLGQRSG